MDFDFETAEDGNIALTAELDVAADREFTLGVAFGDSLQAATNTLLQALATPVEEHLERFGEQWTRACGGMAPLHRQAGDGGALYHRSHSLLLAHEDKTYPGALIASLSIPWGDAMGDEDLGGYHLVWTRDMINSATALLAAGNTATPLRALIYLAAVQRADGGFHQNFWLDGSPYWKGVQLDEAAFPILLAWRLREMDALQGFDPWPMVLRASGFLIRHGPATEQERWEEASGYSPSTLASNIAALTCAARMASERSDDATAGFLQSYADFLHAHVLSWTVTDEGGLVPGIRRHFIRINPVDPDDPRPDEDPDHGVLRIRNLPPEAVSEFPANRIVDAGFLELVRYGLFSAGDDLFEDSLRVVDAVLKVDTPMGPCWRRYNHDGYGQREDGGPYLGWGKGRAWPLLTGERGHYELAAGRDAGPYLRAMEAFSEKTGLLPEQVWDGEDLPEAHMTAGRPTGSAMPLMWAHAEYVKLLRSMADGRPFDRIPEVYDRYVVDREATPIEVWKFSRQPRAVPAKRTLRVVAEAPFRLRWSDDDWATLHDSDATATAAGLHFVDLATNDPAGPPLRFTFFWTSSGRWEGKDFDVRSEPLAS
jgi:glucoamylase